MLPSCKTPGCSNALVHITSFQTGHCLRCQAKRLPDNCTDRMKATSAERAWEADYRSHFEPQPDFFYNSSI